MDINPKRIGQQVRNFERAITAYDHKEPFARFLTRFFKENKQMGSSDRRMTSRFCYNYFRLGKALLDQTRIDRLIVAEFLCTHDSALVAFYRPEWCVQQENTLAQKFEFLQVQGYSLLADVFPSGFSLSEGVDPIAFSKSHLLQPDLFIRVKRGKNTLVERELQQHEIAFEQVSQQAYRLAIGSNLQQVKKIAGLYEVQDLSSQQSLADLSVEPGTAWWDACAASGGKSLLLLDQFPDIQLLVSDVRLSILRNLDERFENAGIAHTYRKKVLDLSQDVRKQLQGETFDGIVLDAPCSGSGTWGRTPEMLSQFTLQKLQSFTSLQRNIIQHVVPHLKPGGILVYITCSVFKEENEAQVKLLAETYGFSIEKAGAIKGYDRRSDSMFRAILRKK